MSDNTNVNNNAAVVVVGRTAPVPPGQQKSEKSIPVVIASDQKSIPVEEQNKVQSEVSLSLLGIPRSEVALGIFADVNTYDVNPSEWSANPEQFSFVSNTGVYAGIAQTMGWGLTHVPEESGALVEGPADRVAVLTSKRFFRYQPGRVSAATFGVKTTLLGDNGVNVFNPAIRKYGIFDNYDGYYWESRNDGTGDNFSVVRRTQAVIYSNPLTFVSNQTEDYGNTNPLDPFGSRSSESTIISGAKKFGDLVILRDNLIMTHAGVYDPSLLQNESQVAITSITSGTVVSLAGLAKSVSNAVYDNTTGIMVVTTHQPHGFEEGKYIKISGIGMTCQFGFNSYPDPGRNSGYNIINVGSTTSFTLNVGVTTVPTYYQSGGYILGLSEGQYVSYSKGTNAGVLAGFGSDTTIYKVATVGVNTLTGISTVTLMNLDGNLLTGLTPVTGISSHVLVTPVPFVQPTSGSLIGSGSYNKYGSISVKPTGMFPYMYEDGDGNGEGYIDSSLSSADASTLKDQIDDVNDYYGKWVNQNIKKDYWNVYEYRVPRSRFSGDNLNEELGNPLLYSDAVGNKRAGQPVIDPDTNEELTDDSIWNLDLTKVTMYKIEFSWYGAVGALFLAYVPVNNGEARWVRVHHLRASNQLKVSSLGNATLPITYLVYGGGNPNRFGYVNNLRKESSFSYGSSSEHIIKYGASYYIDGGDRGTVKLYSYSTPDSQQVYGSKRIFFVNNSGGTGVASTQVDLTNATSTINPYIIGSVGMSTSYYVGAKVVSSNPLDQNIEINFVNVNVGSQRLYLNVPLNSTSLSTITVIPNRPTPLIGLKCRETIQSSTGKSVRNRTQVYPSRMSSGSTGVLKLDLIKSPIFQTTYSTSGSLALSSPVNIGKRGKPTSIPVTNTSYLSVNTGVYGYMRGYYENDASLKPISVLGYLENRGATDGYYFYALKSTSDNIVLYDNPNLAFSTFLKEENHNPVGTIISGTNTEFTLAPLSSVKVNPQARSPIPNTGTVITSIFIPASGQEFDLSSYFDYNKEYLSYPLTNKVESLYLCASSQTTYNSGTPAADVSTSLTWEEQ
jgi:hypothetical protein